MKCKAILTMLLAGLTCMYSLAGFDQVAGPNGYMNVFDNAGGTPGGYLWGSGWGVPDLQALTTDNRTFELLPNVSAYADNVNSTNPADVAYWTDSDDGGMTAGPDGNKWMEALCFFETFLTYDEVGSVFNCEVEAFDLDPRYSLIAFVKILDPDNGYQAIIFDSVVITNTGSITISNNFPAYNGKLFQAGWAMSGLNANPADDWGSVTVTATDLGLDIQDTEAPTPDPMTFATPPYAISDSSIGMTATPASDVSGIEYYFTCTSGGGNDSGWQSDTNYVDTGLDSGTEYTYTVQARDTSIAHNETAASAPASATTSGEDNTAPTPDPSEIANVEASPISIKLTAVTATDASGVEYYFAATTTNGHDSGWQSSPIYVETGLSPDTEYAYTVQARDLSSSQNATAISSNVVVTTLPEPGPFSFTNSLQGLTGNTDQPSVVHELAKLGLETGSTHPDATVSFSANGATFGQGVGYSGRNVLRTISTGFEDVSFEAYATLSFSGATDLSGYIGMGQGIQTGIPDNYGVPELNLAGVNGVLAEFKDNTAGSGVYSNSLFKIVSGSDSAGGGQRFYSAPLLTSTNTIRARIVYNADSNTVSIAIDNDYTGGAFVEDQNLGTVSTTLTGTNGVYSMWTNAPVRIYVGGGEGTVVKDFVIMAESAPPLIGIDDLQIQATMGGMLLSWSSVAGQVYDVQYKTSLTDPAWTTDGSPGCSNIPGTGGSLSVTSTVSDTAVFYQISTE